MIRRASELASRETESDELTETELYRIAGEVGLPDHAIRKALVEVRSGAVEPAPPGVLDRVFGSESVRAARVVPGTPEELAHELDDFLVAGQLLQAVRRSPRLLQYRPAVDWASQVARAASSTSRRYYVASAQSVEIRLEESGEEGRTLVEMEVTPGTRGDTVAGTAVGALAGGGAAGAGLGFLLMGVAPLSVAVVLGVVTGGTVAAGVTWFSGAGHRKKLTEVRRETEGVLDRLELGEELEPPPPAWRRWVKRQFHGARRLLGDDEDEREAGWGA